jgi:3,4-dihydroxy 2-butanone 4-phosphate synthase / GTP cyclohydrolase II
MTLMLFLRLNSIHGRYRTSGLPCDTSLLPTATSNSLRTIRSIRLENTHQFRNLHVSYAGGDSSENVIINGKANPSNSVQADVAALGTIAADMAPVVDGFSADDDELDLDSPTEGFSSIPEAIDDIRQGKVLPLFLLRIAFTSIYVVIMPGKSILLYI